MPKDFSPFPSTPVSEPTRPHAAPRPFDTAEEAWFWFMVAQQARLDGARFTAGLGLQARPCEPIDILKVLDGLYRNRRLLMDHLRVLKFYGVRHMAPDPRRAREARAATLWKEALGRIGEVLERKGIVARPQIASPNWASEALVYENMEMLR